MPINELHERTINEFYITLGQTVGAWQAVEHALANIFVAVMDCNTIGAATIAYSYIQSFNNKIGAINAILHFRVQFKDNKLLLDQEWTPIKKLLTEYSRNRRNELMHGHFILLQHQGDQKPPEPLVIPSPADARTMDFSNPQTAPFSKRITHQDIKQWRNDFEKLHVKMMRFHVNLHLALKAWPKIEAPGSFPADIAPEEPK